MYGILDASQSTYRHHGSMSSCAVRLPQTAAQALPRCSVVVRPPASTSSSPPIAVVSSGRGCVSRSRFPIQRSRRVQPNAQPSAHGRPIDLTGHYEDRGLHLDVAQDGTEVEVKYYGVRHVGSLRNDVLLVPSLIDSKGSLLDNGDISFANGPYWRKHHKAGADSSPAATTSHADEMRKIMDPSTPGVCKLDAVASRASAVAKSHIDEMRKIMDSIFDDLDGLAYEGDHLKSGQSTLAPSSRAVSMTSLHSSCFEDEDDEEDELEGSSAACIVDLALSRSESLIADFAALLGESDDLAARRPSRGEPSSDTDILQRALDRSERILEDLAASAVLDSEPREGESYEMIS